jgi:hypothetical protein
MAPEKQLIKRLEQTHDLMYELDSPRVYMKLIEELIDWAEESFGLIEDDED